MRREGTLEEISDGKLYGLNDMVKADCQDCKGCCDCCKGMGDTVVLDPLDIHRMAVNMSKVPEQVLAEDVPLDVIDGNLLPHLKMEGPEEACVFLNEQGRCSIHSFRPGICRLFPLGRFYEDGSFQYFLQVNECKKTNRSKIKVKKWIDTLDLKNYEEFVNNWHYLLKDVQAVLAGSENEELIKNLNLYVLNRFYVKPYETGRDFYEQFNERLAEARALLSME